MDENTKHPEAGSSRENPPVVKDEKNTIGSSSSKFSVKQRLSKSLQRGQESSVAQIQAEERKTNNWRLKDNTDKVKENSFSVGHNEQRKNRILPKPRYYDDTGRIRMKKASYEFKEFLISLRTSSSTDVLNVLYKRVNFVNDCLKQATNDPDEIVLFVNIISHLRKSCFKETSKFVLAKLDLNTFLEKLSVYIMDLPFVKEIDKSKNELFWKEPEEFWANFVSFCYCINNINSSMTLKLRMLVEASVTKFNLSQHLMDQFDMLRESFKKEREPSIEQTDSVTGEDGQTRENFRSLSVVPGRGDLVRRRPFLRPNIIEGRYESVEHYLDVQFRLLREDCFGPLRDGLIQYMNEPEKSKYDNIRVYENVKFVGTYVSSNAIGVTVELAAHTIKRLQRINLAHSKRFIFGSLLLFTKDNCKTFVVATVLDRDIKRLQRGKIPVNVVDGDASALIESRDVYTMIESEVYFEPYYHVMKALQEPNLANQLAMKKYIVHVEITPSSPSYLTETSQYVVKRGLALPVKRNNDDDIDDEEDENDEDKFTVLDNTTWLSPDYLGLNQSQHQAYHLALANEFAVIQGPPGTGKTYMGVKVAQTLLWNLKKTSGPKLLVVCYTNHALDQFLEALLPTNKSIARIGGQSRNEALDKFNIGKLRNNREFYTKPVYYDTKNSLSRIVFAMKMQNEEINKLHNSVLRYETVIKYVPEIKLLQYHYRNIRYTTDLMNMWLFENMMSYDLEWILKTKQTEKTDDEDYKRYDVNINEYFDEQEYKKYLDLKKITNVAFCLDDEELNLIKKIQQLNRIKTNKSFTTDVNCLKDEIVKQNSIIEHFKFMSKYRGQKSQIDLRRVSDPRQVPVADRWKLYFKWSDFIAHDLKEKLKSLQKPYERSVHMARILHDEARMMLDAEVLKECDVIGMTTTGAARQRYLLEEINPPIVIIEEAAEVMESHIVTALPSKCKHLILIGDHQQLRPSAASARLARHFNIEISLFERMVINKVHSRQLTTQHRMRPEIAALIAPHIYEDLTNHPSVTEFPNVRGMSKNLFFFTHDYPETDTEDTSSRSNHKEAEMVLALANYLMCNGYGPEDVTILTAYSGQMFYMRSHRNTYDRLSGVKITVVDNYQGEESKIILLSLVRNNDVDKIGFLGTKNRVCVALSRAKEGLYIFGNIDLLRRNSDLWNKVATVLEQNESLGANISLQCTQHSECTTIENVDDFKKVPEGGCQLKCNTELSCGHTCPLLCHPYDREHEKIECHMPCQKLLCSDAHPCPYKCKNECPQCCVIVEKLLPCGHTQNAKCYEAPEHIECKTEVTVVLPNCGHQAKKLCFLKIDAVKCLVPCEYRVENCGHACTLTCHVKDDPDHETYICRKPCARPNKNCSAGLDQDFGEHQCLKQCYETCDPCTVLVVKKKSHCKHSLKVPCSTDVDEIICKKKCPRAMTCGHFCKRKCFEECECYQEVKKIIPGCGHEMSMECKLEPKPEYCMSQCEKTLPCGHPCRQLCHEPCDPKKCFHKVEQLYDTPCGHKVHLPCNIYEAIKSGNLEGERSVKFCTAPCEAVLECGHPCQGTCVLCRAGALHAPCKLACQRLNICGHYCQEACSALCPPCSALCEARCPHSRCNQRCGVPCLPCKEPCLRRCAHGRCSRRCGEPCDVRPCGEPCARALPCGHPCAGLCGEPCPPRCRTCAPDAFKGFLGEDFDDDARFILLEDCSHIVETETLEMMMATEREEVVLPACPFCRKPILNTQRYKSLVNDIVKNEINPIKTKVFGSQKVIKKRRAELEADIKKVSGYTEIAKDSIAWRNAFTTLQSIHFKTKKKTCLVDIDMRLVYLNILDILGEYYCTYAKLKTKQLDGVIHLHIKLLCDVLINNKHKISKQTQVDLKKELQRLYFMVQLSECISQDGVKDDPDLAEYINAATKAVTLWGRFDEAVASECITTLREKAKMSETAIKAEREMVVKAINLKAGHWYKCPNGHFYCIGECGGANQIGKCIECGTAVGGTQHRLLGTNEHAPEMDGSHFPAWSQQYNNMANFLFNH